MFGKRTPLLLLAILRRAVTVQAADNLPLAGAGAYSVGLKTKRFQDVERDRVVINTSIWYPALADGNTAGVA